MANERQRLPKNAARVEFMPHAESIKSMLNSGFNIRNVYNKLCQLHNLSMSYFTLCSLVRKYLKEEKLKEVEKPILPPVMPKLPPTQPTSRKLTRPEDVDRNSLF
ncbi:hypothetical protein FACS1894168_0150 [Deltaproteobacteria bacterium]|nr:hypothetical protein FACS1894168_0150 [Deltaproteobacteria bacterium]